MDAPALAQMLQNLFLTIQMLSGYALPESHPPVNFVPLETMQKMVCKRACPVKAFYKPGEGVYMDQALDVKDDTYSRSILLHELVHHLQHVNGRFADLPTTCERWQAREVEAYEIQHKYLKRLNVTSRFIALDTVPITCPGTTAAEPAASPAR